MRILAYTNFEKEKKMKRKTVRVRDISISYLLKDADEETGATLIYLHGFPFNKNMWIPQLQDLPPGVKGIALDLRGHGNTTRGHGFFSIDVFAKDLLAFIASLELENVVVCGCSLGGYIALRAYELNPKVFAGLILNSTHSFADSNDGKMKRFATIESVLKHGKRTFSIDFVRKVFSEKSIDQKAEEIQLIKSSIRRNSETNICATLLALASRTDTTNLLEKIAVPVLIIRGEEDKIVSHEQTVKMTGLIPDVKLIEFADCAHLPNLENSTRFNGEIRNFLISKIL